MAEIKTIISESGESTIAFLCDVLGGGNFKLVGD